MKCIVQANLFENVKYKIAKIGSSPEISPTSPRIEKAFDHCALGSIGASKKSLVAIQEFLDLRMSLSQFRLTQ